LPGRITQVLEDVRRGSAAARDELLRLVYAELHGLARRNMRGQPPGHTLQTTALVHEAYLRLMGGAEASYEDRRHFLGTASRAMRSILVDMARARATRKRGGELLRITFHEDDHGRAAQESAAEVIAIHEALERLEKLDPRKSRVVELRFFGGLSVPETAQALDIPQRTVERLWEHARAWLFREIRP
jgi:RNA polymerase sigma factor (TIGR02999 family)